MSDPLRDKAARLAELCTGRTVEEMTDFITGFLRAERSQDERRVKLLKDALDEMRKERDALRAKVEEQENLLDESA